MNGSTVLVGATGWLGRSIGPAILESAIIPEKELVFVNRSGRGFNYKNWPAVEWSSDLSRAVVEAKTVILSLRPDQFRSASFECSNTLVVSLMAGVTLQELHRHTGSSRIIRGMPNSAVELRSSFTPWIASQQATQTDRDQAIAIFRTFGSVQEVTKEEELNILTGLSGSGPAYTALLIRALAFAAIDLGLDPVIAERAARSTVLDSAALLEGDRTSHTNIIEEYLEYDGVIAAGLNAAMAGGFDASIVNALKSATTKVESMESMHRSGE